MGSWTPPPTGVLFDYQLDAAYTPDAAVGIVVRDWFWSEPLESAYSVCYVNAYQTQPEDDSIERPDEASAWPADVVLRQLPDDPDWHGELLIDLSTSERRRTAAAHATVMLDACAEKGYDAVELDNLDSWARLDELGVAVPFGPDEALAYAELLADHAHRLGLAVARKNAPELDRTASLDRVGFDFAIAEECGEYEECEDYVDVFGDRILAVEYTDAGFRAACAAFDGRVPVILRDRELTAPGSPDHRFEACG